MKKQSHVLEILLVILAVAVLSIVSAFNKPNISALIQEEIAGLSAFQVADSAE